MFNWDVQSRWDEQLSRWSDIQLRCSINVQRSIEMFNQDERSSWGGKAALQILCEATTSSEPVQPDMRRRIMILVGVMIIMVMRWVVMMEGRLFFKIQWWYSQFGTVVKIIVLNDSFKRRFQSAVRKENISAPRLAWLGDRAEKADSGPILSFLSFFYLFSFLKKTSKLSDLRKSKKQALDKYICGSVADNILLHFFSTVTYWVIGLKKHTMA